MILDIFIKWLIINDTLRNLERNKEKSISLSRKCWSAQEVRPKHEVKDKKH